MMNQWKIILFLTSLLWIVLPLRANTLKVITTIPDLAFIAKEIGRDLAEVESLLSGREDAHYVDAVPSFIRKVADADIVCFNGMSLEVGWLPKVLSRSGNAKVQSSGKGFCDASKQVQAIEVIKGLINRSMGDIHPEGNPHYTLSPLHLIQAAKAIRRVYIRVLPEKGKIFIQRYKTLKKKLNNLHQKIGIKLLPILQKADEEPMVIEYHKVFSYFFHAYKIHSFGSIEDVPGAPPSAGRLGEVSLEAKANGIRLAIAASYHPKKIMTQFTALSGIPNIHLPVYIQKNGRIDTYEKLQHHIADSLLSAFE